jgi:hypothetical protein
MMKISKPFFMLAAVTGLTITTVSLSGCIPVPSKQVDEKSLASRKEAEIRMKSLLLVLHTSVERPLGTPYPDLSNAGSAKRSLLPTFALIKKNKNYAAWNETIFIHPASGQPFLPNPTLSKVDPSKLDESKDYYAFYAPAPEDGKRLVGYTNFRVKWVEESEWPAAKVAGSVK